MLTPVFSLNLNRKILPGKVTIGKYDGVHACITALTTSDKILIHNPHVNTGASGGRMSLTESAQDISILNINQAVTALAAGRFVGQGHAETLIVGTQTNVLAYDVYNNTDVFYVEVPDGANCLAIGMFGKFSEPLVLVGGNSSIHGFDSSGKDVFWTVTGYNVTALALADFDFDGINELLVGTEDSDIRVYKNEEIIAEMTETDSVTSLCHMQETRFGYSLSNGTVGVYDKISRWWRIKSKNQAISIYSYDIDGDGAPELITGWSNGKIDARNDRSGEVVFKDNFDSVVAGIVEGDYRLDGRTQLLCVSVDGEVRGYQTPGIESRFSLLDANIEQETIRELSQRRHNLLLELKNYDENQRVSFSDQNITDKVGIIPANTQLQTGLAVNPGSSDKNKSAHVEIALATTNDTLIRTVIIFAEGIFEGESYVYHPKENLMVNSVRVPIFPPKDIPVDLHIKAAVGYKNSDHFHIFELTRQLPKFSMYALIPRPAEVPDGYVKFNASERVARDIPVDLHIKAAVGYKNSDHFHIFELTRHLPKFSMYALIPRPAEVPDGYVKFNASERVARVLLWINSNFLLLDDVKESNNGELDVSFSSLRTSLPAVIHMTPAGDVLISTDELELAAELIQSMAAYLNIDDLQVEADFPNEFEALEATLEKVEDLQTTRQKLRSDMADNSELIRALVVRAEDSRMIEDFSSMKKYYQELYSLNGELMSNYRIRLKNHTDLVDALKKVNQIIQKAGRLRVGKFKTKVVNLCRQAIKNENFSGLTKIMKIGEM